MKEKLPLSHKLCAFRWLISRPQQAWTSSSKSEVSKSNSWKITSFSKTMALQREPFLTIIYTINLSPLLVTKKGFMPIIILSIYQQCSLPLIIHCTFYMDICCNHCHVVLCKHTLEMQNSEKTVFAEPRGTTLFRVVFHPFRLKFASV